MVWLVVSIAIAGVFVAWYGIALVQTVYGYPIGRYLLRRAGVRLDEKLFLPADVQDLDEALSRVVHSHIVGG